jgi:hypothetical protein
MNLDSRLKVIHVNCYSGYKANERPIYFTVRGRKLAVEKILDRWYGIDHSYFKILADDQKVYLIKHDPGADLWTLEKIMGLKRG